MCIFPTFDLGPGGESLTSPYAPTLSPLTNGAAFATTASPLTTTALQAAAAGVAGKQVEGEVKPIHIRNL